MTTDNNKRYQLLNDLTALLPGQFEEVLFRLDIPRQYLSGSQAPQSLRSVEVIRYLEAADRSDELQRVVAETMKRGLHGPLSSTQAASEVKQRPIHTFISYAERDRGFRDELRVHLKPLEKSGELVVWDTTQIYAGASIQNQTLSEINRADLVLFLISADFLFADALLDLTTLALKRHQQGLCTVVPIIVRPCSWQDTPFREFQSLPRNGKALTQRTDRDSAWTEVVAGLRLTIQDIHRARRNVPETVGGREPAQQSRVVSPNAQAKSGTPRPISDIFRTAGTPNDTFVEPARFGRLRIALSTMGKGLIVEGPSGIGKSVAVKKALEELGRKGKYTFLSAVHPPDLQTLEQLLAAPLANHIIVDDFHRLAPELKTRLANLIKYMADSDQRTAKLTLIGVNQAGMSLTSELPDLAGRVDIFVLGRQPDAKIEQLIEKGERAANLAFVRRADFVLASLGSFYTAQELCLNAAGSAGIEYEMATLTPIEATPGDVIDDIMKGMHQSFRLPLLGFTAIDSVLTPRGACLALLWLVRQGQDGCVLVREAKYQYPSLALSFDWLSAEGLSQGMTDIPGLSKLLFYDVQAGLLSIENPRLEFYLRNMSFEEFGKSAGLRVRVSPEDQLLFS